MPKHPAQSHGTIRTGIGGWTYEPWRGTFYPEGLAQRRELEHASRALTTIEVNGTYYGSQKPATFESWHDETPEDFVFALKAPRFATNRKVLGTAGESIRRFFDSGLARLGRKLGPINWQFMATKRFEPEEFAAFLALLPPEVEGLPLRHAVEVRHDSFRCEAFLDLARKHGVAVVTSGDSDYPLIADPTADFVYARIMGTSEGHPLGYAPKALDLWADRARSWAAGGAAQGLDLLAKPPEKAPRDVFLYVISGFKERNPQAAMALRERLG